MPVNCPQQSEIWINRKNGNKYRIVDIGQTQNNGPRVGEPSVYYREVTDFTVRTRVYDRLLDEFMAKFEYDESQDYVRSSCLDEIVDELRRLVGTANGKCLGDKSETCFSTGSSDTGYMCDRCFAMEQLTVICQDLGVCSLSEVDSLQKTIENIHQLSKKIDRPIPGYKGWN